MNDYHKAKNLPINKLIITKIIDGVTIVKTSLS